MLFPTQTLMFNDKPLQTTSTMKAEVIPISILFFRRNSLFKQNFKNLEIKKQT